MSTSPAIAVRLADESGAGRLGIGAGLGFAGALIAIVVPMLFLFVVATFPGGFVTFGSGFLELASLLVLVGAVLLFLSLLLYRRGFAALRRVDRRFHVASILCLIGSLGFLLLVVTAALVAGNPSSLLGCAHGRPSHALSCLESGQPVGAATGLVGFFLGWVGGLGVVLGLGFAGRRFRSGTLSGASGVYAILLVFLLVPLLGLFVSVPSLGDLILFAPLLAIVGPALALVGSLSTSARLGPT
jgi:hypothetical protein